MPNRKVTNTAKLKGRELLRRLRTRFPALFPADRGALKPWAVGYLYRQDHRKPGLRVIAISGSHQVTIFWSRLKLNENGPTLCETDSRS